MKKKYIILLIVLAIEFTLIEILESYHIKVDGVFLNAVGAFLAFLPIEILLFCLGKDENIKKGLRMFCIILFWFFIACYSGGLIANVMP